MKYAELDVKVGGALSEVVMSIGALATLSIVLVVGVVLGALGAALFC